MKILAIDFGLKKMGFAIGNETIKTANPLEPLQRKTLDYDIAHIKNIIDQYGINKVVFGYPLNMDGTKSEMIEEVEKFAHMVQQKIKLVVDFEDERLSSFEADEILKPYQPDLKKRIKLLDSMSAVIILKNYMGKG